MYFPFNSASTRWQNKANLLSRYKALQYSMVQQQKKPWRKRVVVQQQKTHLYSVKLETCLRNPPKNLRLEAKALSGTMGNVKGKHLHRQSVAKEKTGKTSQVLENPLQTDDGQEGNVGISLLRKLEYQISITRCQQSSCSGVYFGLHSQLLVIPFDHLSSHPEFQVIVTMNHILGKAFAKNLLFGPFVCR